MSGRTKLFLAGLGILIVVVLVLLSTYKVQEGEQAILLQFGEPRAVVNQWGTDEPGLRFKTPFVQNVEYFEKRVLDFDAPPEEMILSDQKRLVVDSFIRYRIVDPDSQGQIPRTLAYVEIDPQSEIEPAAFLGRFVGVRARGEHLLEGSVDPMVIYTAAEIVILEEVPDDEPQ